MYVIYTTIYENEYTDFNKSILGYCDTYAEAKEIVDNSDGFVQFKEVTYVRDTAPIYYLCNIKIDFDADDYNKVKYDPDKFHKFIEDLIDKEIISIHNTMANILYIGRDVPHFNTIKFTNYDTIYILDVNVLLTANFDDLQVSGILCADKLKEYIDRYTDFSDENINEFNAQEEKNIKCYLQCINK